MKPVEKYIGCRLKSPRLRRNRVISILITSPSPAHATLRRRFPMTLVVFQVGRLV